MLRASILIVSSLILAWPFQTKAQEVESGATEKRLRLDPRKSLKVDYYNHSWNKNKSQAETAALVFRDGKSGKIAKIEVQETGPDTSIFVGSFGIQWADGEEVFPEVYIVSQEILKQSDALKKIDLLIRDGVLIRKPFFLRSESRSTQAISVFDTREQAYEAYGIYKKEIAGKPLVEPGAVEAQRKSQLLAEQKRLADLARLQDAERLLLEAAAKKKAETLKRQQAALDAAERARRQKEAQRLAAEGMAHFQKNETKAAEAKFERATELDPSNNTFYFQYGVTLYKNEKHNQSIVILKMAEGNGVNTLERDYFIALNHMKLKDYDTAFNRFDAIKQKNDKALSPSAAFFNGIIDFQKENYERSKTSFEYVLDNSEDPQMDAQAESYIEQIANMMAFQKEKSKKWILSFNTGFIYDSNILSKSNSDISNGTATNLAGLRFLYSGSAEYRPLYTEKQEFSSVLSLSDMYSTNTSFAAEKDFQDTDPLSMTLYFPWKFKGLFFGKPGQMSVSPGYERVDMNADKSGSRELILSSGVLKADSTLVMTEDWFAGYTFEFRKDWSAIPISDGSLEENDSGSATKISLSTSQTFFRDKKKSEAWIYNLGYARNMAVGANSTYTKIDVGATYMMPWKWETSMTTTLSYYNQQYPDHKTGRTDNDLALTWGLSKPLTEKLTGIFSANYTNNASTLTSSDYNKYSLTTMVSWRDGF